MKLLIKIFYILSLGVILTGCAGDGKPKYVLMDEVKKIDSFPYSADLIELPVKVDAIGLSGVKCVDDSLLIISHASKWSIFSSDGKRKYGECLSVGQGPDEFSSLPRVGAVAFLTVNDSLISYIPDTDKGRVMAFNVSSFIKDGRQQVYPAIVTQYLSNYTWSVIPCNDKELFIQQPTQDFLGFQRFLWEGDSLSEFPSTKKINEIKVKDDADINLLSMVCRYDPDADKFVEAMIYLNQINIYSKDGTSGKTICIGTEFDNLMEVENGFRVNRRDTYISVSCNRLGFGAIYSGNVSNKPSDNSEIQFFNWEGDPVCRYRFPFEALAFDIDIHHKRLWVINRLEDSLICYDATPILKAYGNII